MGNKGLIQIYTGNGKGKSTSALGQAIRAIGAGKKVAIVYFDKGGTHYSERRILEILHTSLTPSFASSPLQGEDHGTMKVGTIEYFATGLDRIDSHGNFRFGVTPLDQAEAKRGLEIVRDLFTQGYDLIILDEINSTITLGMLPLQDFLDLLAQKPDNVELVLTGRNCPPELLERADLITDVTLVKHYFYKGVKAREGFDY